jgi:hypothetical protein
MTALQDHVVLLTMNHPQGKKQTDSYGNAQPASAELHSSPK